MGDAGVVRAFVSVIIAALYPIFLRLMGASKLLFLSFATYGIIVLKLAGTHNLFWGQFTVAAYSIPMIILMSLPMAITVKKSSRTNRGKHLGALNTFAVIPQLIDTTYTGYVSKLYGEHTVMRIGGVWSLMGALFALLFLRE